MGGTTEPLPNLKVTLDEATPYADYVTRRMRVEMVSVTTPIYVMATPTYIMAMSTLITIAPLTLSRLALRR